MSMILVDGSPATVIPADDRGFTYGDGVFRTLAVRAGHAQCWEQQYAKLAADCRALGIEPPAAVIPADDRGFSYGDGVFRTLALRD